MGGQQFYSVQFPKEFHILGDKNVLHGDGLSHREEMEEIGPEISVIDRDEEGDSIERKLVRSSYLLESSLYKS